MQTDLSNALQDSDGDEVRDACSCSHWGQQRQVRSGQVRSGQQGINGLSPHLSNALQDSDGDEVGDAGPSSHRGQQGQESRAQTPKPEQLLAPHPLCQPPSRELRHDVPVKKGTQDGALSLLIPVKLSLKIDEIGEQVLLPRTRIGIVYI